MIYLEADDVAILDRFGLRAWDYHLEAIGVHRTQQGWVRKERGTCFKQN